MLSSSVRINKKYAIDLAGLYKVRNFNDGVSFLEPKINLDIYIGDHNPKFEISLVILNVMVFQIVFYNVNHKEENVIAA